MTSVDIEDTEFVPPPHLANYWVFVKMDALVFLRTLDKSTGATVQAKLRAATAS